MVFPGSDPVFQDEEETLNLTPEEEIKREKFLLEVNQDIEKNVTIRL